MRSLKNFVNIDIISNSIKDTFNISKKFSKEITIGDNIFLIGNLGAGKTFFAQNLLKNFGVKNITNSPSFKLINEYNIIIDQKKTKCYHFDLYRLQSIEEILDLGWDDYLNSGDNICIVEWADKAKAIWDSLNFYEVYIDYFFEHENKTENFSFYKRKIIIKKHDKLF